MAWTVPSTVTVSQVLTASFWNTQVRDNLAWLGTDKPQARVYNSAAISHTTSGVNQALTFDSERKDVGGMHSTSSNTSRLTIPTGGGGTYVVGGGIEWASNVTGSRQLAVRLNGATFLVVDLRPVTTGLFEISTSTAYSVVAADYFELTAYQTSGGALNVNAAGNYSPEFYCCWQST